jgi:hypothetical protein
MEVKEVEAAEMVAEEEAVRMEDLSVGVVAYPHPPLLSLVSREEAVGSIPMAAEAIGMIQETIKTLDQQGNAGGSHNFFADHQQKECGGSAEMAAKEVEVAEMEVEDDAAKEAVIGSIPMAAEAIGMQEVIGIVCNNITSKRHSCHSPCLFGVSAEVPLDVTESVADADDDNVADTDDVPKSRAPPAGKLGFKGKRANKKFGRGCKRGSKHKACRTSLLLETEQVPAIVNDAPNIALAPRSRSSKCKVTKIQLIQQLGQATRQLNLETTEKGIALFDIRSITKKLTKPKEVVGQLRDCLRDARTEIQNKDKRHSMEVSTLITSVAETANDLRTEHESKLRMVSAMSNDLAEKCESIQNRHKCTLTAVSKKAESKLRASDRRHQLELLKMTKVMIAKDESMTKVMIAKDESMTKVMIAKDESHVLDLEEKDTETKVR